MALHPRFPHSAAARHFLSGQAPGAADTTRAQNFLRPAKESGVVGPCPWGKIRSMSRHAPGCPHLNSAHYADTVRMHSVCDRDGVWSWHHFFAGLSCLFSSMSPSWRNLSYLGEIHARGIRTDGEIPPRQFSLGSRSGSPLDQGLQVATPTFTGRCLRVARLRPVAPIPGAEGPPIPGILT